MDEIGAYRIGAIEIEALEHGAHRFHGGVRRVPFAVDAVDALNAQDAAAFETAGRKADALRVYEKLLVRQPNDVGLLMKVGEVNEEIGLAVPEDDDWDTIGGYLFHRLGHVPDAGEEVHHDGLQDPTLIVDIKRARAALLEALDLSELT